MTVHTDRHLILIDAASSASTTAADLHGLMVRAAVSMPLYEQIPVAVIDRLADLEAIHGTACDVYDSATANLDSARQALAEAAQAYAEAEAMWSEAGAEMNEAAVTVSQARKAAGVRLTATGYVWAVQCRPAGRRRRVGDRERRTQPGHPAWPAEAVYEAAISALHRG
jgi:hypothetical protein